MAYDDLQDFIADRKKKDDLIEIKDEISPELELTWILSEEERIGRGKTMLFENVKGYGIPVVGNIFSTQEKMNSILGDTPENIGNSLRNLIRPPKESDSLIGRGLEMMKELGGLRPKLHDKLPSSYSVLDSVDLGRYPICTTWPDDAGPFITLPVVITGDPETGRKNADSDEEMVVSAMNQSSMNMNTFNMARTKRKGTAFLLILNLSFLLNIRTVPMRENKIL